MREKEQAESEEFKDNELQRAKTLKNKNLNEATVAQGLLEVFEKKMEDVIEQSRQSSRKRSQLEKNKKDSWKDIPNICLPRRKRVTEC